MIDGDVCFCCGQDIDVVGESRKFGVCLECFKPTILRVNQINKKSKGNKEYETK